MIRNSQATVWHVDPESDQGKCSICGMKITKKQPKIQHRKTDDGWERRMKSRTGWKVTTLGIVSKLKGIPLNKTRNLFVNAAAYLAANPTKTYADAARVFGVVPNTFHGFRRRYAELWKETLAKAKAEHKATGQVVVRELRENEPAAYIRDGIRSATALLVGGATREEVSDELGVPLGTVEEWKQRQPKIWAEEFGRAMNAAVVMIRRQAGTDAVLKNANYLTVALVCDKWAANRGEPLFPPTGETTVSSFFEDYYLPNCLFEATKGAVLQYRGALKLWRLITGDPPLKDITNSTVAVFRDCLLKKRGLERHLKASPSTIRSKLRLLQTLLDKSGPAGKRNRDAAGLIETVPYAKPPKAVLKPRTIVSPQQFMDTYTAAVCMSWPKVEGFKAAAWWRALLVTSKYTGLRSGTLFSLRMTDIRWKERLLVIPGERMKAGRDHTLPLHDAVVDHLMKIRTDRELVFPLPGGVRVYHVRLHKLQDEAGLSRKDHFGLQSLRRTLATTLYEINPEMARLMLGHVSLDTTRTHYVCADGLIKRAVESLPSWDDFAASGASPAEAIA